MFKLFFRLRSPAQPGNASFHQQNLFFFALGLFLLTSLGGGCLAMRPLPKVNLSEPGWSIQQGQAVWQTGKNAPQIAGELLFASRPGGATFVQFTKTPFPFAIAQTTSNAWEVEFPPQNRHYAAPGKPPARIVWFQLANALTGKPLAKGWTWKSSDGNWQLKNTSGESLEGYLAQ